MKKDRKTLREICAPLQEDFEKSGMSEEELTEAIDQAVSDVRAEMAKGEGLHEGLHAGMTFEQLHAPLQEDFEKSGMSEEELGELIDRATRRARRKASSSKISRSGEEL